MDSPVDPSRRSFLRLRSKPATDAIRPPWTDLESLAACTGCGSCIVACPEKILRLDSSGRPEVDFQAGSCTFCGDCAKICQAAVFDLTRVRPWAVKVAVSDRCLPNRGILCESCRDICIDGAIGLTRTPGQAPVPAISSDCTGCGACISICPAGAISAAWQEEAGRV